MVAPITGPFVSEDGSRTGSYYKRTSSYKQKRPYNLNLNPFELRIAKYDLSKGMFTFFNPGQMTDWILTSSFQGETATDNAAYSGFIGKMRAQNADFGVTLGEQKAARAMIITRSKQLFDLADALARRDFRRAYGLALKDFPNKRVFQPKSFSSLYLEWSWGWRPMIEDIGDALNTLVDPIVPIYARAAREKTDKWRAHYSNIAGSTSNYYWRQETIEDWSYNYRVSTGAKIAVSNPNVALANRLGLLNLPKIVWNVQPFSFIVDKYINIGQMIGSLADTFGFTLSDAWTSRKTTVGIDGKFTEWQALSSPAGSPSIVTNFYTCKGSATCKKRIGGLLGPSFTFRSPSIGSFGEAASYFALLTQLLSRS